jgi:hypothetical protein
MDSNSPFFSGKHTLVSAWTRRFMHQPAKGKKKRSSRPNRRGFLFRMGLHLKIMFIIANALTKPGFYLSFVLLAFERESFAALFAANLDLDFLALHRHPPVCSPLTPLADSAVTRLGCPFSAHFNLFLMLDDPQR